MVTYFVSFNIGCMLSGPCDLVVFSLLIVLSFFPHICLYYKVHYHTGAA